MDSNTMWLRGNLVVEPIQRTVASGHRMTSFRMASNTSRRDPATGEWSTTETLFMDVTCWRRLAENVFLSLHKGDAVEVRGRLRQREYDDANQNRVTRYEVDAYSVTPDLNRFPVALDKSRRSTVAEQAPTSGVVPAQTTPVQSGDPNAWNEPARPSGEEAA